MKINIKGCSRCGGNHEDVETLELTIPFAPPECAPTEWTHWAPCPTNHQPIMVMVSDDASDGMLMPSGQENLEKALPVVYQVFVERRVDVGDENAFLSTVREFFGKWKPS